MTKNQQIFVQIASYRDPELSATLEDCIFKADAPDNLVFSIAWQHCDKEFKQLEPILKDLSQHALFKVISIPWELSRGACWARNMLQQQYDGEAYTLQLDSHHRFAPGWDTHLKTEIDNLISKGVSKPVLTGYLNRYLPPASKAYYEDSDWTKTTNIDTLCIEPRGSIDTLPTETISIRVQSFTYDGIPMPKPIHLGEDDTPDSPIPAYFYSGHFCFSVGQFAIEIQHDPHIYFIGEEPTIALRAFTHGYDLFHPVKSVIWHEYDRSYHKHKHWDDHVEDNRDAIDEQVVWHERELASQQRCLSLFGVLDNPVDLGEFGLGTDRTIQDYMQFSGIDYQYRAIRLKNGDLQYTVPIKIESFLFKDLDKKDIKFICCAAHDQNMETLYRLDITPESHPEAWSKNEFTFDLSFTADVPPTRYVVWPCMQNDEWPNRHEVTIWNNNVYPTTKVNQQ